MTDEEKGPFGQDFPRRGAHGVDLELIEWYQNIPLEERVRIHQDRLATIREVQRARSDAARKDPR